MSRRLVSVAVAVAVLATCFCTGCGIFGSGRKGAEAEAIAALPKEVRNAKDGAVLVLVPGGQFLMGEAEQQKKVTLPAYYIDRTEVTNAQYAKFLADVAKAGDAKWRHAAQPASKKDHAPIFWDNANLGKAKAEHPVVGVDWFDAYAYAKWAGKRLPTEAEWERAARGTKGATYPWGEAPPEAKLKFRANYFSSFLAADHYRYSAPVGSFGDGASPEGCLNLAGNASEWCADWYAALPEDRRLENPKGPDTGTARVVKGGAWNLAAASLRAYNRWQMATTKRQASVGFRCAKDVPPPPKAE